MVNMPILDPAGICIRPIPGLLTTYQTWNSVLKILIHTVKLFGYASRIELL